MMKSFIAAKYLIVWFILYDSASCKAVHELMRYGVRNANITSFLTR